MKYPEFPGREIIGKFSEKMPNGYSMTPNCHQVLAGLNLPLYMTSNYDDFLFEALKKSPSRLMPNTYRRPERVLCRWNTYLQKIENPQFSSDPASPTADTPWVFHLHGHIFERQSMVLTEDDYLEFLVNDSMNGNILPSEIEKSVAKNTLLFLGYALEDLNFRVILRRLASYLRRSGAPQHFAVQLSPTHPGAEDKVKEYFEKVYHLDGVMVYWGTCDEFLKELLWARDGFHG